MVTIDAMCCQAEIAAQIRQQRDITCWPQGNQFGLDEAMPESIGQLPDAMDAQRQIDGPLTGLPRIKSLPDELMARRVLTRHAGVTDLSLAFRDANQAHQ